MNAKPLMKCGHTANGTLNTKDGEKPYCVICDCQELAEEKPTLTGRKAACWCCGKIKDSDYGLPFFKHNPDYEYDEFYCGCDGWD